MSLICFQAEELQFTPVSDRGNPPLRFPNTSKLHYIPLKVGSRPEQPTALQDTTTPRIYAVAPPFCFSRSSTSEADFHVLLQSTHLMLS